MSVLEWVTSPEISFYLTMTVELEFIKSVCGLHGKVYIKIVILSMKGRNKQPLNF